MSRTLHHYRPFRIQLMDRKLLPWYRVDCGRPRWICRKWNSEIRNYHKAEMRRDPEDPFLSNPHRITSLWDLD